MSKADEMFERLNYIEHYKNTDNEVYRTDSSRCLGKTIIFQYKVKRVCVPQVLYMEELQAISEKFKELGWMNL